VQEVLILSKACKYKQETTISFFSCPGVKQLGREADKHQRHSPKMKNQPDVTALTLFIDQLFVRRV